MRNQEAGQHESPRKNEMPKGKSGRYIAVAIRRQVYERAQGRCEFVGRTGRRCGCTARLEIDHIGPFCEGGNHSPDNLRLLCDPHNRYAAEMSIRNGLATRKHIDFRTNATRSNLHAKHPADQHHPPNATQLARARYLGARATRDV